MRLGNIKETVKKQAKRLGEIAAKEAAQKLTGSERVGRMAAAAFREGTAGRIYDPGLRSSHSNDAIRGQSGGMREERPNEIEARKKKEKHLALMETQRVATMRRREKGAARASAHKRGGEGGAAAHRALLRQRKIVASGKYKLSNLGGSTAGMLPGWKQGRNTTLDTNLARDYGAARGPRTGGRMRAIDYRGNG